MTKIFINSLPALLLTGSVETMTSQYEIKQSKTTQLRCMQSSLLLLKEQCHDILRLHFFSSNNLSWPKNHVQKRFWIFRIFIELFIVVIDSFIFVIDSPVIHLRVVY